MAILPWQMLGTDPKSEMFCTGLVIDLITDLSRFRSFHIISFDTISGFHPNEKINSKSLHTLDLDYVVKGLVRDHSDSLVFNIQLISAPENRLVWAEKFTSTLDNLFDVQDEIAQKIVASLQQFVDEDMLSTLRDKPLRNLNAYELWLRGFHELRKGSVEADEAARVYFQEAIRQDPNYARAYTGMSLTYFNEWSCQIWDRWEVSQSGAFEWASKALDLDEKDHISAAIVGKIFLFNGEYDKAEHFLRESLRLNPNDPDIIAEIALSLMYLGFPEESVDLYHRAHRLNPAGADRYAACGAFAYCMCGDFVRGIEIIETYHDRIRFVDFPAFVAAAYYQVGNFPKMWENWEEFLRRFAGKINKGEVASTAVALQWMIDVNPFKADHYLEAFWDFIANEQSITIVKKAEAQGENIFCEENQIWYMSFRGKTVQLPALKGFYDLAKLLSQPNAEIHCTELMNAGALETGTEAFDAKAKASYQRKISKLRLAMSEAEESGDTEQLARLHEEYDTVLDHLSAAIGKHGRVRQVSSTTEKSRTAVTWRIRSAIRKINEAHPLLGKHLDSSIRTGVFCTYMPETQVTWQT